MADKPKQLRCEDYHVAWICPVADLELLPARLMLDEEHNTPQYDTHFDENTYVFGSIKGHTVVIGTCPAGETGNVNAARLSGAMFKTFPNIRIALLVGIGGGVPRAKISNDPLENIHLGDVVVGWPGDGSLACIYHDRGKATVDGFEIVGTVQNPEWRLINALGVLKTDHEMGKTSFNDQLAKLQRLRRVKNRFARPDREHDKLFQTVYPHEGESKSECTDCDQSKLVRRPQRTEEDEQDFVFHFGRIACGNSVIKDAVVRDEIRSKCNGALCVEMEAAGVDASRRCLVIRGISDYADSHKSDLWQSYAAGKAAAFTRELLCRIQPGAVKQMSTEVAAAQEASWLVPLPRPPSYVGRETQLSRLIAHISSTDTCRLAIYGLGGCGKTALALETAYQTREMQPERAVFWVPAVSQASFEQAFRDIGAQLRIPDIDDSKSDAKQLVKLRLSAESMGPWLMIVDNADDRDILYRALGEGGSANRLIDYLPYSRNGSIIFTTRTRKVALDLAGNNVVELGRLNDREARDLLRTRLLEKSQQQLKDDATVKELLDILAFFALAIVQAVAYINENDISLADYVRLYRENEQAAVRLLSKEFEDQGRYRETKNPIATTWYISFEQIRRHNKLAAEYLSFMACTLNSDIPTSMLPEPDSEMDQTEALGILKAYGFMTKRGSQNEEEDDREGRKCLTEAFDIHPLVHLATGTWLKSHAEWTSQVGKTVEQMCELLPPRRDMKTWRVWSPYLPHARHVCNLSKLDHAEPWADLIDRIARCHYALGQYRVAEQDFWKLLTYQEDTLGEKHEHTLTSLDYIGEMLRCQNSYREAEQMHRRTFKLRQEVLSKEHPDTLTSMNNLALTLDEQGKYVEAEQMHRQDFVLREKVFGSEHPHTLTSMHNLALVLGRQGKTAEAEQMYRQVVRLREQGLGKEDPEILISMHNLAKILSDQRKYQEAEELHRKTLGLREKVLGEEHPETLTSMNDLASTLDSQGKYQEAEELHRETLGLRERVLGTEHEATLVSVWWVGQVLRGQHRYNEALAFYERACEGFKKILGSEHSDTQNCARGYAFTRELAGGALSESEDDSLSDGPYESHAQEFQSEDSDPEDSSVWPSTKPMMVAAEEEQVAQEGKERPDPMIALALKASKKHREDTPHVDQVETQVQVEDNAPIQKETVERQGGTKKKPPPPKTKPVALKGRTLSDRSSNDVIKL